MDDQTDLHRLADALKANGRDLEAELEWLAQLLQRRLAVYFAEPSKSPTLPSPDTPPPPLDGSRSPYARFIQQHELTPSERALLLLALAPHLRPQLLDVLWTRNETTQRGFSEFGGMQGIAQGAFLPTGETAAFLLAGDDLATRLATTCLLAPDQKLARLDVLQLAAAPHHESALTGALQVSRRFLGLVTHGREAAPTFDQYFPARRVQTELTWRDLVLPNVTLEQLEEIRNWLQHGRTLLHDWGMASRLRPGFTSLFCGPPGTGKTLSACLLGKLCDCEVYKIDLSMVVSKYIGETEKNLARVFDQAEHRGWILFFDEADALFGKRTRVEDSHDRYANQEISFLLQRIEDFDGVVILASNLRHNIDDAFLRRFQSVVQFPMPRPPERLQIWREAFPVKAALEPALDLVRIAERHELSGGTIVNVARYAALKSLSRGDHMILSQDVDEGIRRELQKEGRAF
jgi:ATPase family protein associated with various cellular activities (AAA)